uniref:BPTI/Kunitz inhibitor domain-containing protein n=1 Tax=Magallana gigas TaxID=29159 RepID=A0A8W8IA16_MAGGI
MGSSGNNRMSITNFGPLPNKPNNNLNPINRRMQPRSSRYISDVPYQCTMYSDAGYFCPYRYEQPSTRYFFNVYSGRCESFYYLGCGGNLNNYGSREDCLSSCACFISRDYGNYYCPYGGSTRWYFNKYSGTCQSFYYSGCNGGNDNNFQSQLECQSTCAPQSSSYYYNRPINEPNFHGVNGINMHGSLGNEAITNSLNNGNNGVNINSIAQIWKMATNAMNADAPPNGEPFHYQTSIQFRLFKIQVIKMLKFGVLVLLPFVLGGAPHGSGYALNRANNQGNRPGPAINMGSSGNNRMSITNFGPLPNKPNNNLNPINRGMQPPSSRYISNVPYQCTMYSDAGYFCPYRYEQPSTRYFFNVYSGRCESFYYQGCGGNLNNYGSREDCLSSCACFIYPDHGNYYCPYGGSTRWYFDKYSGTCQSFYYSGCNGGNDNNFQSQLECQSTCAPQSNYGPYYGIVTTNNAINSGAQSNANPGANGINMHGSLGNEAIINGLNNGNNGVSINSISQIWKMATNAMNADAPPNGVNMIYPSGPNQRKSGLTMY